MRTRCKSFRVFGPSRNNARLCRQGNKIVFIGQANRAAALHHGKAAEYQNRKSQWGVKIAHAAGKVGVVRHRDASNGRRDRGRAAGFANHVRLWRLFAMAEMRHSPRPHSDHKIGLNRNWYHALDGNRRFRGETRISVQKPAFSIVHARRQNIKGGLTYSRSVPHYNHHSRYSRPPCAERRP